jgi:magnesium chelatase subunit D
VLPADMLAALAGERSANRTARSGGAGQKQKSPSHGRPVGVRAGMPGGGRRLALIETLRAAAPWQGLRARADGGEAKLRLRRSDLRIRRYEDKSEALAVIAVDASGSSARARLAEAKGAIELLLAQAYAKRVEVALVAFRGAGAEILLPPTRSLTRARRLLAELPGGGGTPLAAGLDQARALALAGRARGRTPHVVVLTDGRANIAADGSPGRPQADSDAMAAAKRLASDGFGATVIDISPRAQPEASRLAESMRARYLHLPRADAAAVHAAIGL